MAWTIFHPVDSRDVDGCILISMIGLMDLHLTIMHKYMTINHGSESDFGTDY